MLGHSVPVLCYHNMNETDGLSPGLFEEHLEAILEAGYRTVSANRLLEHVQGGRRLRGRCLVLTFDDCHLSNWLFAAPALAKRDMTGTFFAVTDFIGQGQKRTPDSAPAETSLPEAFRAALRDRDYSGFMNRAELEALVRDLGMEVFAHGARHQGCFRSLRQEGVFDSRAHWSLLGIYPEQDPALPAFEIGSAYAYNGFWPYRDAKGLGFRLRSDAQRLEFCARDMARSLERIRAINNAGAQLFCWPWGQFDALSQTALREAGFQAAFTLERWPNRPGGDPFRLSRLGVAKTKSASWLASRLRRYSSDLGSRVFFKLFRKKPETRRVLYATDSIKLSGGGRQMVNNAQAMIEAGVEVLAALPADSAIKPALEEAGARIKAFDGFADCLRAARFFKDLARTENLDVVHTFHSRAYKGAALARLMGARFRLFINRGVVFKPNLLIWLWSLPAKGVICNSMACARVLRRRLVRAKKLNVVYNSFAPDLPEPAGQRKKRGLRVVYVGNEGRAKGFDLFLYAAAAFCRGGPAKDVEFAAVGVTDKQAFQGLVPDRVMDRVAFPGLLDQAGVMRELSAADILVIPSRQESLPNVLLEAFAAGLPVVASRAGGIPELVGHNKNGLLCPVGDVQCLADMIRLLAEDPAARSRMGAEARRLLETRLTNRAKGLDLLRVYSGQQVQGPLNPGPDQGGRR
ncbi:MAG: glycosyltransferase [Desulfovibrionaceae bacterium]|nr:glycosyltransferase [Desulfovibrionaceae bacterium]